MLKIVVIALADNNGTDNVVLYLGDRTPENAQCEAMKITCTCGVLFDDVEEWGVYIIEADDMGTSYGMIRRLVQVGAKHVVGQGYYETSVASCWRTCGGLVGDQSSIVSRVDLASAISIGMAGHI